VNCLVSQYADLDLNSEIVQRSALGFTNKATVGVPHCGEGMFQSSDQDRTSQAALGRSCSRPWPTTPRSRSSDHKRVPGDRCPVATIPHIRPQQNIPRKQRRASQPTTATGCIPCVRPSLHHGCRDQHRLPLPGRRRRPLFVVVVYAQAQQQEAAAGSINGLPLPPCTVHTTPQFPTVASHAPRSSAQFSATGMHG